MDNLPYLNLREKNKTGFLMYYVSVRVQHQITQYILVCPDKWDSVFCVADYTEVRYYQFLC